MPDACSFLPEPTPLRRAAVICYQWGEQKFEIWSTACSIRSVPWEKTGELMTWLHCKARPVAEIAPEDDTELMTVLIPAHYVTCIHAGPTFRLGRTGKTKSLGIFPPIHAAPTNRLPLPEIERVLTDLLDPGRN